MYFFLTSNVVSFPNNHNQTLDSPTPTVYPTIQFNSDTSCPELAQTPEIKGSVPQDLPPLHTPATNGIPTLPALQLG